MTAEERRAWYATKVKSLSLGGALHRAEVQYLASTARDVPWATDNEADIALALEDLDYYGETDYYSSRKVQATIDTAFREDGESVRYLPGEAPTRVNRERIGAARLEELRRDRPAA